MRHFANEMAIACDYLGLLYAVTDVQSLYEWVVETFAASNLYERVADSELSADSAYAFVLDTTEEGQKVTRNQGEKFCAVYKRTDIESPFVPKLDEFDANRDLHAAAAPADENDDDEDGEDEGTDEEGEKGGNVDI